MFLSFKLHIIPYLNHFTCFNNILKKISFSCYIKCNTSYLILKIYVSLRKGILSVFSFHFHVLNENEGKSKKYINFSWQFIFFFQNCINFPVFSVSWRINILSKKEHLYFSSQKRNVCNFTKKVSFHRKSKFFDDFLLISYFSLNNKQKTLNIATIYFF